MIQKLAIAFASMSTDCRHGVYVWWLTAACLTGIMVVTTFVRSGVVAEHAVDAFASIMTILVTSYLGIEAISRSQILNKLAERVGVARPTDDKGDAASPDPAPPAVTAIIVTPVKSE